MSGARQFVSLEPRRGFSLVELLIVMAIIAVAAAMVVPSYNDALLRYHADASARRLAFDIAGAQAHARAVSSSQSITFTAGSNVYQLPGMPDPNHPAQTYAVNLSVEPYDAVIGQVSLTNGLTTLTFDGYGAASTGGTIIIQAGAYSKTVSIDPSSGVASIQ